VWAVPLLDGSTIEVVGSQFDGDLLGSEPLDVIESAADAAYRSVADTPVERTVHLSFGDFPAQVYMEQLFADHLIHAWDLAVAIGAAFEPDPDLVEACSTWFADQEDGYRAAGAIGQRTGEPGDGFAGLLVRFGRDPAWSPPDVTGTLNTVRAFNQALEQRDLATLAMLLSEDTYFDSTPAPDGEPHRGREDVISFWRAFIEANPEARFGTEEEIVAGDRAIVRWRYDWSATGHVRGVDLFRVANGQVAEKLSYVKG
jgi:ketosteroid isomerase-like protein